MALGLYADALAALSTASVDDLSPAFGGHTRTKSMGTVTLQIARLEGSFHVRT